MKRCFSSLLGGLAAMLVIAGCTDSDNAGTGGSGGVSNLEWPPDATVYFDQYGIPHADCATDEDCAMVLGYQHAFDRFVQMDFRRRFATGRFTDILDKALAQTLDVPALAAQTRALFSTRDGRPAEEAVLESASMKTRRLLQAYSSGVNRWIDDVRNARNGAVFPRELAGPPFTYGIDDVPPWTSADSIATIMLLIDSETNRETLEVNTGIAREAIDNDTKFSDLWSRRPVVNSTILPPGWAPPGPASGSGSTHKRSHSPVRPELNAVPALQRLSARLEKYDAFRRPRRAGIGGSNNWAIAPSRSVSGNALLAFDPHLAMTQPAVYYLAHLDAKTNGSGEIHTAGVTAPGLPWVISGQNERIAWGSTNTFFDMSDVYIEELAKDDEGNPIGVIFQGRVVPFTRVPFEVRFNDGTIEEHELLFVSHHGPVREIDAVNNTALTLRWTAQDTDTDIEYITALNVAENVEQAREALENVTTVGGNFVVTDTEGNIGWFPYNRLPRRNWATNLDGPAPPWLPLDGRGDYEWTEYFDYSELPQVLNPPTGFVATANNDMTGALSDGDPTNDGYPPLQTDAVAGVRHARIVDLIESIGTAHTTATMHGIQSDVYSLTGELTRPGFLALAKSEMTALSEDAMKVLRALESWNFTCPTGLDGLYNDSPLTEDADELAEAAGCAAFHGVLYRCGFPVLRNKNGRTDPSFAYFFSIIDPSQLAAGDVYWDDPATPEVETKYQGIAECFGEAAQMIIEEAGLGSDETQWAWGRMQTLTLDSDLAEFEIDGYNNPLPGATPFANDGGYRTVDVTSPNFAWEQNNGAVMRLVCEGLPSGQKCTVQLPGGQSGDVSSANYEDLLLLYLRDEPIDLVFDIEEAREKAVRTVRFE